MSKGLFGILGVGAGVLLIVWRPDAWQLGAFLVFAAVALIIVAAAEQR